MGGTGEGEGEREDWLNGGIKPLAASDPARIGPYLLLGRLGAGGMGRVFLARSDSGRTVAVKVVHEEHVSDERFRARFRREIEAARKVGERYTAPVLDAGPGDQPPWVATGYVPGLSLEQVVRRHGPLPAASLHALAEGLLKALKDIHGAGIVHRDLKPSNVMLTVDGTKVIDFGIARALESSVESMVTSTGLVVGSPGFMSPEQVRGLEVGAESDVFSLGCVLTYAATGQLPFGQGASNQHAVMFQIVEGEPGLSGVGDDSLRAFISRCLTKDIDRRPGVDELLADPERTRPLASRGAWLPAGVVAHLAQQSAQLLDAEAAPLREEPADRATVGLRPAGGTPTPEVVLAGNGAKTREPGKRPRRRVTFIALPIVAVITVGGGTVAVLQPFGIGGGGGTHAQSPGSSANVAPGVSNSPSAPSSSPAKGGHGKGVDSGKGKGDKKGQDGSGGSDQENAGASSGSSVSPGSGSGSGSGGGSSSGGGSTATKPAGTPASGGGSSSGSAPPAMKSYNVAYNQGCVGACSMPLTVSWTTVSRATRYDIHFTNKGSNFTAKNIDTIYATGGTSYTIKGPYSGDEICVAVRAANKYGASAWAQTWCGSVPY
ncbi:serine/threonine-protein kinase [Streptomyces beijiangensis]|uniref:non-specific serine/threonine protein kinase n=1 Tax=Streptomyces beijiangensis TaxID=163361 RepID=A0A939JL00_9ACTN|nr:serine/threonine-protein kinase [Streptomyces beijiangensis]MBO0516362.1 serine/threonine protein kinase [Streptomyces beijiangensis]